MSCRKYVDVINVYVMSEVFQKIIGPERNVNCICIIHSHTKYQVNISKHSKKKWGQLFYFGITELSNTICPSHLVAGTLEITLMSLM